MSAAEANDEVPKELVSGKYQCVRLLGRGGMGSVWEGVHTTLGARVAVKFIEAEYAESPEARQRFENEARAAATLRSKHVVQVYDHGLLPDGRPFIVMEFLAGEPLDKRLDRLTRLPAHETARIVHHVCRALSKAHEAGIVHRDLKPENVFLVWDDEDGTDIAKVVDFGIAKFTEKSLGVSSSTRTGSVLGTPFYMSPEQARGLRSVDYRSDLWSVAVIAFRCMVGKLPFEGEAVGDLLVKICTAPLPVPTQCAPGIPPAFDAWFAKALQREPDQRFRTATELADSLNAACGIAPRAAQQQTEGSGAHAVYAPSPHQTAGSSGYGTSGSGVQPSAQQVPAYSNPNPASLTGSPFTTSGGLTRPSSKGPIVAAAIAGLVVVGIGVGVLAKVMSGAGSAAVDPAASADTAPVNAAIATVPPPPKSDPPTVTPTTEVPAAASAAPAPSASAPPKTAVAGARPREGRRPPAGQTRPKVEPKPAGTKPGGTGKPTIDVGY